MKKLNTKKLDFFRHFRNRHVDMSDIFRQFDIEIFVRNPTI